MGFVLGEIGLVANLNSIFDKDPVASIRDLSSVSLGTWSKLIANESLWANGVVSTLFPEGRTLILQLDLFVQKLSEETIRTKDKWRLTQLIEIFEHRIRQYYLK